MKKVLLLICCLVGYIVPAWGCSYWIPRGDYEIRDGEVYYQHNRESAPILVEGVDVNTFLSNDDYRYKRVRVNTASGHVEEYYSDGVTTFTEEELFKYFDLIRGWYGSNYASDATYVYYKGKRLDALDSTKTIFLRDKHRDGSAIEGIKQPGLTDDGYVKDNEEVYYRGELLGGANGAQLRRMPLYQKDRVGDYYVMDDQQIYFYGEKVAGDPRTAFELRNGYYLDAKHIYFRGEVLEGADPNNFDQKSGIIASNGYVFFRNERLPLDGNSLEELNHTGFVGCLTDTHSSSILKDKNGVYSLRYTGEVLHLAYDLKTLDHFDHTTFQFLSDKKNEHRAWASDHKQVYFFNAYSTEDIQIVPLNPQETYQETFTLDARAGDTFYRSKSAIYHINYTSGPSYEKPVNFSSTLGVDAQSFDAFATLWKAIIFRDNTSFYLANLSVPRISYTKLFSNDAKLVCLGKSHSCFIHENRLYYVFDDGTIQQYQVVNGGELRCMDENILLENWFEKYNQPGLCFDDKYFYHKDKRAELYRWDREKLLPYTINEDKLEGERLRSLHRFHIESKPLIIRNGL